MQAFTTTLNIINSTESLNAFKNGDLSLAQLSKSLNQSIETTLKNLSDMKITIADYSIEEELAALDKLGL